MGKILDMRRTMGGSQEVLPCGAVPIEYLESTGAQYIDTGLVHLNGQKYAIDIIATPTANEADFLATLSTNGGMIVGFYAYFIFGYNRPNSRIDTERFEKKEAEFHIEYDFKNGNRTLTVNGISYNGAGATYSTTTGSIRIFASYDNISSRIKCKKVVFKDADDNLIIDMIPVRVNTTGYMYDKVSKRFFGNAGTGEFILGPDK